MKTQIEQEPVACIYNGNQYMRHEFMDDKIPEGATPLYAAPVDFTRLETEYTAATLRINNDLLTIAALTAERDAYADAADSMAAAHKIERDALKAAAKLALDALESLFGVPAEYTGVGGGGVAVWRLGGSDQPRTAIAALKAVL